MSFSVAAFAASLTRLAALLTIHAPFVPAGAARAIGKLCVPAPAVSAAAGQGCARTLHQFATYLADSVATALGTGRAIVAFRGRHRAG